MFIPAARRRISGIVLLLAILAAAGIYQASRLPSAIFPSVTFPIVKVIADVGEESAARMMPTVTRPLEEAILRVPGVEQVRSTTSRGSSELSARFHWGTDMQVAMQRVEAETQRIRPDLPAGTALDIEWMNPATFPIQGYALVSDSIPLAQLTALAEFTLKPALIRIPGVSQVQIQGGRRREFQVHLNRAALEGRGLAVSDVVDAIAANHLVESAGLTERNHELYLTLVNGRVHGLDELGQLAVPVPSGPPATLAELGTIRVDDEVSYVRTTAAGHPAVLLNLIRQPSANTVDIAMGVRQLLHDQPGLLPPGIRWITFYDQASFVSNSVRGTRDAILVGMGLAALVLLFFLRDWRLTVVAVLAIPLTVAIAGLALSVLGQTINLMTLAGIAATLGLVADDAIVVVEDIEHHRRRMAASGSSDDPAAVSIRELLPALISSSLSTIVILIPFALLGGIVGAFFKPLALTMAITLVVSFFVAVLVVPIVIGVAPPPLASAGASPAPSRSARTYAGVVHLFLRHRSPAIAATVLLIVGAWLLYRSIGTDFLPAMDEGSIVLDYWTPPGTSLSETDAMLRQVERVIVSLPDVATYSRRTGTELGFFITEPNRGDYVIKLKPHGQRRDVDAVIEALRSGIAGVEPAVQTDFGQLIEDEVGDLTGGAPQPIDVKLFGDDPAVLQQKARLAARAIAGVPGVEDVFDGLVIAGPALQIDVNSLAAARFGLTTERIHAALEPAVTGTVVDQIRIGERMYDLRVFAASSDSLGGLHLRAPSSGELVPLAAVARVVTGPPEVEIDRENLKSFVGVTARISGRDLGSAMQDVRRALAASGVLTPGITVEYGGLYAQQQASFRALFYVLLAGLGLVAVILLFQFGDWRAALVTVICAAAVLAGVLAALLITGQTLNISSYVGAIMMVGIVGENAIFVIHEARMALARGMTADDAWTEAAHRRLRPVMMTILATACALAPLALGLGQGSQLMQPLAIAVIGGFVLSGPIVLLLLPGLYRLVQPEPAQR